MVTSQKQGRVNLFTYICSHYQRIDILKNYSISEGEVCITDSGKEGKCLLFENCSSTLASVQNGGKPKLCGFHKNGPLVCCDEDASRNLPISMNSK